MTKTVNENIRELEEHLKSLDSINAGLFETELQRNGHCNYINFIQKQLRKWQQLKEDLEGIQQELNLDNAIIDGETSDERLKYQISLINEIIGVEEDDES